MSKLIKSRALLKKRLLAVSIVAALALPLGFYMGSYLFLTTAGRFEPGTIGLNGVKSYRWAPKGFVSNFKWNREIERKYAPLYYLDQKFWHPSDAAYGSKYPVNEVRIEDIAEVYRAWRR